MQNAMKYVFHGKMCNNFVVQGNNGKKFSLMQMLAKLLEKIRKAFKLG